VRLHLDELAVRRQRPADDAAVEQDALAVSDLAPIDLDRARAGNA
jgi:hypothetical protein